MINIKKLFRQDLYVSPTDQFLAKYDSEHKELSPSQRKEVEKYKKIFAKRDQESSCDDKASFWDKF